MNEENQNENVATPEQAVEQAPATETTIASEAPTAVAEPAAEAAPEAAAEAPKPECEEPQIIIQKERGFAHYVGFALLCVLCICFFFIPGIALTILSFVIWLIFKLKIKGFKKSFYWYIGLCGVVLAILIAIEVLTEKLAVFGSISALLLGGAA